MELKYDKIQTTGTDTPLKIVKGHFATNHAHTNYYFDLTTVKSRLSEAGGIAQALVHMYLYDMIVDTIVCMEGTEVIGTLLAQELTKGGFMSKNAHKTIYVIKPEFNSNSQIVFKDNYRAMINGKNADPHRDRDNRSDDQQGDRGCPVLWRNYSGDLRSIQRA